jgi:predicted Rossmann fold nucleotide-binding protein DprA/Smf involved in DNA uptake
MEWNAIAERVAASDLKRPRKLLGLDADQLVIGLGVDSATARRIAELASRGAQLALELERLESLGIWVMTRADDDYPMRLKRRLRRRAPAVLFGVGQRQFASAGGLGVVGSRELDDDSLRYATEVGRRSAEARINIVSGGSRGADRAAMAGALGRGGVAVGVLAEGVERSIRDRDLREYALDGQLCLLSPYYPGAPFKASNAMARNKLIYCLSDRALVVASSSRSGGTWTGAIEALKAGWVPIFARESDSAPEGNSLLVREGARPLAIDPTRAPSEFVRWLSGISEPSSAIALLADNAADDLLRAAWDLIRRYLTLYRSAQDIADRFGLYLEQATIWLERAEAAGLAVKTGDRYRIAEVDESLEQQSLPLASLDR